MAGNDELACVYAALILADDQVAVTVNILITRSTRYRVTGRYIPGFERFLIPTFFVKFLQKFHFKAEKISTILKAAGVSVEPYWPGLFAKALEGVNVKELITNIGSAAGAAPAGGAAPAEADTGAAEAKKEEKKEESEESDDDMGFGLFD